MLKKTCKAVRFDIEAPYGASYPVFKGGKMILTHDAVPFSTILGLISGAFGAPSDDSLIKENISISIIQKSKGKKYLNFSVQKRLARSDILDSKIIEIIKDKIENHIFFKTKACITKNILEYMITDILSDRSCYPKTINFSTKFLNMFDKFSIHKNNLVSISVLAYLNDLEINDNYDFSFTTPKDALDMSCKIFKKYIEPRLKKSFYSIIVNKERIIGDKYTIYVKPLHEFLSVENILNKMSNPSYPLCLGQSDDMAVIENIEIVNLNICDDMSCDIHSLILEKEAEDDNHQHCVFKPTVRFKSLKSNNFKLKTISDTRLSANREVFIIPREGLKPVSKKGVDVHFDGDTCVCFY